MRLLLDEGLPRSLVDLLAASGIGSVHVAQVGLRGCLDSEIMDRARFERSVIVTLDSDFHALLAMTGAESPSVIRIRVDGLRAPELAALIVEVIETCTVSLAEGAVLSVTPGRIAVRKLPIARSPGGP